MKSKKCKATIEFGDDHGDNSTTFHCQLKDGHTGKHQEVGDMGDEKLSIPYTIMWQNSSDELEKIYENELKIKRANCKHTNKEWSGNLGWCSECGQPFEKNN